MSIKTFASESGHYYTRTGEPAYTIIGTNGKERNTTIRDARKFSLVPSVTEVMKMLPKPDLDLWKMKNVLMSALTIPRHALESDEALVTRILLDAQEQAKKAAEKGTAIHGAIERHLHIGFTRHPDYAVYTDAVINALQDYVKADLFEHCDSEKSFAHPLGYGGKVDLHSRELNFICDFKTKSFDDPDKVEAYDENKIQLAAYRIGLDMPEGTRLINVFISTSKPGLVKVIEHDPKEEKHYWEIFRSLLNTWKLVKKYAASEDTHYVKIGILRKYGILKT